MLHTVVPASEFVCLSLRVIIIVVNLFRISWACCNFFIQITQPRGWKDYTTFSSLLPTRQTFRLDHPLVITGCLFLRSPSNFAGPKPGFKIKILRPGLQVLSHKLLHFPNYKKLNLAHKHCKHKTAFWTRHMRNRF